MHPRSVFMVYQFITGTKRVTPLGLEKNITIKFKHGCKPGCRCRPTASTCDPSITLPIHFENAKDFEEIMDSALEGSSVFGFVWSSLGFLTLHKGLYYIAVDFKYILILIFEFLLSRQCNCSTEV
jgi:hypothetical protein